MKRFHDFEFVGHRFYRERTVIPLGRKGVSLLRGLNLDATAEGSPDFSNGAGKSLILEVLEAFILGKSQREHYKTAFTPDFEGTLSWDDTVTGDVWSFTLSMKEEKERQWKILRNGVPDLTYHQPSECQSYLARTLGITAKDWSNFVHIDQDSLYTLLRGTPTAKREYLDSFFNLDAVYEEWLRQCKEEKLHLEEVMHELEREQAKLGQTLEFLRNSHGVDYLRTQTELAKDTIALKIEEVNEARILLQSAKTGLASWKEYHDLCLEAKNRPSADALKARREKLTQEIAFVQEQKKLRTSVELKERELSNLVEVPEPPPPEVPEPEQETISAVSKSIHLMRQKTQLFERYQTLKKTLPVRPERSVDVIAARSGELSKENFDLERHVELVSKGATCTECGQDLSALCGGLAPAQSKVAAEEKIRANKQELRTLEAERLLHTQYDKIKFNVDQVASQLKAFPVFGRKLEDAEQEEKDLLAVTQQWRGYRGVKDSWERNNSKRKTVLTEIETLKSQVVLVPNDDLDDMQWELNEIEGHYLTQVSLQKSLTEVLLLAPEKELEAQQEEAEYLVTTGQEAVNLLGEEIGSLKSQLATVEEQEKVVVELEKRLAPLPELRKSLQLTEALVKFFSPAGFKMYELRKRCTMLVDKLNYWSHVFCQEIYEWSLPADLKQVEFLVRPVKNINEAPFPAWMLSRGERNRASRVLLFSQLSLTPPTKSLDILFLDEIEANLDKGGQNLFAEEAIRKLKETFPNKCIILVSHDENLKTSPDINHLWCAVKKDRVCRLDTTFNINP